MKICRILFLILFQIIFFQVFSQQDEWTWMNGDNFVNSAGNYGVQGVPNTSNTPPGIYEACEWTDLQGNFWLFGGYKNPGMLEMSDLWKYDPTTNQWTWIKGPGITQQAGVYGTQGVSSITNSPGARGWGCMTWTDSQGYLWLFGGWGWDVNHEFGQLNDLWKYDISTNEWTWIKGSNIRNQLDVYGTITVPDPANCPGGRNENACTWTVNNELWFFGGEDVNNDHNDLWRYDIATNVWTWMKGTKLTNQPGVYGTKGVPDPANVPGTRRAYCRWKDSNNNLWLFGGYNSGNRFNDLWKYDMLTGNWTWMSGTNVMNAPGNYGTLGVPSVNNIPPFSMENRACWVDDCGNFWEFGAEGRNDLWMYIVATNEWAWMSGSSSLNQPGVYGTETVPSPLNMPGARSGSVSWKDKNGYLWFFGGLKATGLANDLWRYAPVITVNNDTSVCTGDSAKLHVIGGVSYTYTWAPANTLTDPNSSDPVAFPTVTTLYKVTATNIFCAVITDSVLVTVTPNPEILCEDTSVCKDDAVVLQAGGGTNYSWNTGSTVSSITVSPQNTTIYTVTGTNGNCSSTDEVVVTVNPLPSVNIGNDTIVCAGIITLNPGNGFVGYLWQDGSTSQTYSVTSAGVYSLEATDINGCIAIDDIRISSCSSLVWVPDAFTPNGDGKNDYFLPMLVNVDEYHIYIYDRWGQLVFETKNMSEYWDGKFKGEPCPGAVYSWLILYTYEGSELKKYGHVSLIR